MGLKVSRGLTRLDYALANVGLAAVVLSYSVSIFGFPVQGDLVALAGFTVLLAMVLLYAAGTSYALLGIVHRKATK